MQKRTQYIARFLRATFFSLMFISAVTVSAFADELRNLTLEQAIELLQKDGLTVLYSSDLVKPWMRVREEPDSRDPLGILEAIVAPYDLAVADGPNGTVMLVRSDAEPVKMKSGKLVGVVRSLTDNRPVAGVTVSLGKNGLSAITNASGQFEINAVPTGNYDVEVVGPYLSTAEKYTAEVRAGETIDLDVVVVHAGPPGIAEVIVSASQYELMRDPGPSINSMSAADLDQLPDLADDPMRAVARLPGTASDGYTAKANIRGGESDETLVQFDGVRLHNPFHLKDFQSLFSTIDPAIVRSMNIYTGGFPVTYGDRMSGVIDITPLQPSGKPHREVSLSFFNTSGLFSGNFNEGDGNWMVSARRGNLHLLFDVIDSNLGDPKYKDFYGRVGNWFTDSFSVTANFLLFDDDLQISDSDKEENARADYKDTYFWLRFDMLPTDRLEGSVVLAHSKLESHRRGDADQEGIAVGILDDKRDSKINSINTDWSWSISDELMLQFGGEYRSSEGDFDYMDEVEFEMLFLTPGTPKDEERMRQLNVDTAGDQIGLYTNVRAKFLDRWTAEIGARWDKETLSPGNDEQTSPRAGLMYEFSDRTRLRASWGRFFQAQSIDELQISDGITRYFPAQQSDHALLSFEHMFENGLELRLEAYRKDYDDLRPRYENLLNTFILLPELKPDRILLIPESAVSKGAEISVQQMNNGPLSWWASYSYSTVEDKIAGMHEDRSWDQTHLVNVGAHWKSDTWEFSAATTWHTGWPTTHARLVALDPIPLFRCCASSALDGSSRARTPEQERRALPSLLQSTYRVRAKRAGRKIPCRKLK